MNVREHELEFNFYCLILINRNIISDINLKFSIIRNRRINNFCRLEVIISRKKNYKK